MIKLSWQQFDDAADSLAAQLGGKGFKGVCGMPRGGLPLAVALSHRIGVPLLSKPRAGCLVVDDIFETGKTLCAVTTPSVYFAVWITKSPREWVTHVLHVNSDEWVLFPWECEAGAAIDEAKYRASR